MKLHYYISIKPDIGKQPIIALLNLNKSEIIEQPCKNQMSWQFSYERPKPHTINFYPWLLRITYTHIFITNTLYSNNRLQYRQDFFFCHSQPNTGRTALYVHLFNLYHLSSFVSKHGTMTSFCKTSYSCTSSLTLQPFPLTPDAAVSLQYSWVTTKERCVPTGCNLQDSPPTMLDPCPELTWLLIQDKTV